MPLWQIVFLAVIQGIAEFLPISSSGHIVVLASLLSAGAEYPKLDIAELNIVLHFGTLLSILVFYRRQILKLLGSDRRVIWLLIVATLPAVVIGLSIKKLLPSALETPLLTGGLLILNAAILWLAAVIVPRQGKYADLNIARVLGIGLAQAVAILPGISRSGTTIAAGLAAGLDRRDSATFAFLMAIPAILGASVLEGYDAYQASQLSLPWQHLCLAAAVSFVVGLFALWLLLRLLENGRLAWFAYWCLLVGASVVLWQLASTSGLPAAPSGSSGAFAP